MTREQGLELVDRIFSKKWNYAYDRVRYAFIALDGETCEYVDNNDPENFQQFTSFLESDYGKAVIRQDVSFHITAEEFCRKNHLIWLQMCCNPKYDPVYAIHDYKPEGWQNFAFFNRTWEFEKDLLTFPEKAPQEKNQFALNIFELMQDTKQIMVENEELFSQALRSLISPNDFAGKPWTLNPEDHTSQRIERIDMIKQESKREMDFIVNQVASVVCDHITSTTKDLMTKEDYSVILDKLSNPMSEM